MTFKHNLYSGLCEIIVKPIVIEGYDGATLYILWKNY